MLPAKLGSRPTSLLFLDHLDYLLIEALCGPTGGTVPSSSVKRVFLMPSAPSRVAQPLHHGEEAFGDRSHPAGAWPGAEPVHEMTISLLLYPDRAPSRWEMADLKEEPTLDTLDRFMGGRAG